MAVIDVYLSLGSNLGNRERNLKIALNFLELTLGTHFTGISSVRETEAVGFDGPAFLNLVVRYRTSRSPLSLLSICKRIEQEMGRTDAPEYDDSGNRVYHDRVIDIDILLYGKQHINTQKLTIPHKALPERPFFQEMIDQIKSSDTDLENDDR